MKTALTGFGLTTGGLALALATLGLTVDIALGAPLAQAAISGDTEITGLTIAGLVAAGVVASAAIWRGGRALFNLGNGWGELTRGIEAAKGLADVVKELKGDVETNRSDILDLKEWRATMDPQVFRARRREATDG